MGKGGHADRRHCLHGFDLVEPEIECGEVGKSDAGEVSEDGGVLVVGCMGAHVLRVSASTAH